jgi:hypothetical protein
VSNGFIGVRVWIFKQATRGEKSLQASERSTQATCVLGALGDSLALAIANLDNTVADQARDPAQRAGSTPPVA